MPSGRRSAVPISFSESPSSRAKRDVVAGDRGDALVADVVDVHRHLEREPREDRHLRGRVGAADVIDRVGLGVAQPLRLGERLLVVAAGAGHLARG